MNTFKERLAHAAKEAGIEFSQTAIAKSLGLRKQTVDYWMTKGGEPRPSVLFRIADTYSVDARWLATGEGTMLPPPGGPGLRSEELELVKGYRKASAPHRASLRVMAKSLGKAVVTLAEPRQSCRYLGAYVSPLPFSGRRGKDFT